jgi:YesN/AraC family two-component response regulator
VKMPLMDGPQTLAALREFAPEVRCCFMSGYTEGYGREQLLALGASHFFAKPFRVAEITEVLRELLGPTLPGGDSRPPAAGATRGDRERSPGNGTQAL